MDIYNRRVVTVLNENKLMQVTASDDKITDCNVQKNDVFFTPSSETPNDIGRVHTIRENLINTVYSYHLVRYRPKEGIYFDNFPDFSFASNKLRCQMILNAQGVQRFTLSKPTFENLAIDKPTYDEQKKITNLFNNLDNLITCHQRK